MTKVEDAWSEVYSWFSPGPDRDGLIADVRALVALERTEAREPYQELVNAARTLRATWHGGYFPDEAHSGCENPLCRALDGLPSERERSETEAEKNVRVAATKQMERIEYPQGLTAETRQRWLDTQERSD